MSDYSKYIVYVDESGDANWKYLPEYPLLCVNYCLFEKKDYLQKLIPQFNSLKFKYWGSDNLILHERDLRKPDKIKDPLMRSKYALLSGEKRQEFMQELTVLMEQAAFKCFCVLIDKSKIPEQFKVFDPYHISLSRGFRQLAYYLHNHAPDELNKDLHIVFEKRGHDDDSSLSKAYQKIQLQGSLSGASDPSLFKNFRLELMDKKANSTGLQFADLTARPIGNHYLTEIGAKSQTDQRAISILMDKLHFCDPHSCQKGTYDIVHESI